MSTNGDTKVEPKATAETKVEPPTITVKGPLAVKVKKPKRVEQRKKLAAISKETKARKARELMASAHTEGEGTRSSGAVGDDGDSEWTQSNFGYVVGLVGMITAAGSLYLAYRSDTRANNQGPSVHPVHIEDTNGGPPKAPKVNAKSSAAPLRVNEVILEGFD